MQGFPERRGKWPVSAEGGHTARMACRREGVVLAWAGWHADGGERGVAGGGGTAGANGGAVPSADRRPICLLPACRDGRRFLVYEPEGAPQYRPMVVQLELGGAVGPVAL